LIVMPDEIALEGAADLDSAHARSDATL
jgi:hypothetical protein